ncbi:hypothetical protein Q1695_002917 [Nippostrongylus brasiliensis]|nr:hypothetical protein Q1695_002917 [Nippostrongylus brasiliensis]
MTPLSLLCLLLAIYATSCSASQFTDRGVDGALELSDDNIQDGQLFGKLKRARNPYSWMLNEAKRARNPYSWMARQKARYK